MITKGLEAEDKAFDSVQQILDDLKNNPNMLVVLSRKDGAGYDNKFFHKASTEEEYMKLVEGVISSINENNQYLGFKVRYGRYTR